MQTLQILVRNLAVIILLATVLEMLLPNKSMRGYVQLVVGMFVITAILNPISSLLHMPLEMGIPAWTSVSDQGLPVLASDNSGKRIGQDAVREQYRQILVNQVEALALGVNGVKQVKAEVKLQEGNGELTDQPRISRVHIRLLEVESAVRPIEPVTIGQSAPVVKELSIKAREVQERVAGLMELKKEQIIVQEG
ncbi:MAG: stage III sporulation protein AF [Desulfitobacteriaceae bacterium]|nr:stage III sporulation protein AF [Desulfitobacteriaceae bacterium]MDD4401064.1 stage III sporulation protein AF [Desulfitobacteriaceae bacterium]